MEVQTLKLKIQFIGVEWAAPTFVGNEIIVTTKSSKIFT
jgi:hypothetical protein